MEAVITADVLRRGGVDVTVAGLDKAAGESVFCSRKVRIVPDCKLAEVAGKKFDAVILPGGAGGAKALAASAAVGDVLRSQYESGGVVAAICAAPIALKAHGIAKGKKLTSYPAFKKEVVDDYEYLEVQTFPNLFKSFLLLSLL